MFIDERKLDLFVRTTKRVRANAELGRELGAQEPSDGTVLERVFEQLVELETRNALGVGAPTRGESPLNSSEERRRDGIGFFGADQIASACEGIDVTSAPHRRETVDLENVSGHG